MNPDHGTDSQLLQRLSPRAAAALAFVAMALLCSVVVAWLELRRIDYERARFDLQVGDLAGEVEGQIDRALSATYALAAMVRQGRGTIAHFDEVATAMLPFYPGADSLQLARGGVVSAIVPLAGNERAIGHDLLADRQRTREAFLARDSGRLTLAGPFDLLQGGLGAVGRLPVFLDGPSGEKQFWGFTSVLVRFPKVLEATGLAKLAERGVDYEIARVHPDTGQRQRIAASNGSRLVDPVVRPMNMPNGVWTLSASPHEGWLRPGAVAVNAAAGALISLMAAWLARQMVELRRHRRGLEDLVRLRTAELEARQAELLRLSAAVEQSPVSIVITDAQGTIEYVNPKFEQVSGYSAAEAIGRNPRILKSGNRSRDEYAQLWATISSGQNWSGEFENLRKNGSRYYEATSISPIRDAAGAISGYVGVKEDVTQRRADELRMREAMVVFNASSQAIMITDADGVITSVNPACCSITGYGAEEIIGQRPSMFRSDRHDEGFYREMWSRLIAEGTWEGEVWNRRKDGSTYLQWITITAVRDEKERQVKYVSHASDITSRRQREEVIWRQANFDELTGLANRHLLHDRLRQTMAQARRAGHRAGLMLLDLDGFKWVNDTAGHDAGDRLLVETAARLTRCVREQDTVARMGGDEFTLVIGDLVDAGNLRRVAEKVLRELAEPFVLDASTYHVSASIGLTVFPEDGADIQTLLRNADVAMYEAKLLGKNRCEFYAQHLRERARRRVDLETELRGALEHGELSLHYQPIVRAADGVLVGAEALLRWTNPRHGMVEPAEFIPVAEETGMIVPIGEWAIREAAHQLRRWTGAGQRRLRMAVNVSGVQYREAGLPELIERICEEARLQRSDLMLEITESVLMQGGAITEERIGEISRTGVLFALDDFGTGYSSLSYLKRFPVAVVKIDRGFVADCVRSENDARLVEAIIRMAHGLNLTVTAEGVETVAQAAFLRERGCDFLQGFIISRPLAAADFERLFEQRELLPATVSPHDEGESDG